MIDFSKLYFCGAFGLMVVALPSCTQTQLDSGTAKLAAIEVQAVDDGQEFCQIRDKILPFVKAGEAIGTALMPEIGALVALDQTTVNPGLNLACKFLGGLVVAEPK